MFESPECSPDAPGGASDLACVRAKLDDAAAALAALSPEALTDGELSELLVGLDGVLNRLEAGRAGVAGAWDARLVWAVDGARSGASWLASHSTASRPAAGFVLHLARRLRSMPATAAAFAAGEIGTAQLRLLLDAAREAPDDFEAHEELLVGHARSLPVNDLARVVAFWKALANPDGAEGAEARRFDERGVRVSQTLGGMWHLDGSLPPEMGELVRDALDREAHLALKAEKALADANGGMVTSTPAQRRADALATLLSRAGAAGDEGGALNVPSMTAVLDAERLCDPRVAPSEPVGETAAGEVVTKVAAERLTCDCEISRVVLGPGSVPVDLGMTARLPNRGMRRALAARYRGCAFPGCDIAPGWTQAHHVIHWTRGGPTDIENLVPLCPFHHRCVHEGGFGLTRLADGQLEFTRPDGSHLVVPRGRAPDPTPPWRRRAA